MAYSKTQTTITDLGKNLVKELGNDADNDTLSCWMAHYVAELLTTITTSKGAARASAQERCFQTILSLWDRRANLPNGRTPFHTFENIFRALDRLDPETNKGFFYPLMKVEGVSPTKKQKNADALVDAALNIDRTARILLDVIIALATENALTHKTKQWLKVAPDSSKPDVEAIRRLAGRAVLILPDADQNQRVIEHIQEQIAALSQFTSVAVAIRKMLEQRLRAAQSIQKKRHRKTHRN
jgi:hypothetical protein